jgi:excinuclease UvrABC nuclease subunit
MLEVAMDLLSEQKIVDMKEPFENIPGIYFLIKDDKIVYVGKSVHIPARIRLHSCPGLKTINQKKDFDYYAYITCEEDKLDLYEQAYIKKFQPWYNGTYNRR